MKISKPTIIFMVIAGLVLVYIIFFTGKKKPPPVPANAPAPVSAPQGAAIPASVERKFVPQKFVPQIIALNQLNLAWDRDPFLLPKVPEKKGGKVSNVPFKLVAILEGRSGRMVILGTEIVRKGEMVGEEKVLEIGNDRVVLVRGKTRRVLILEEPVWPDSGKDEGEKGRKKTDDRVGK
ncbi:MAG: hypothetical protein C0392_00190 [Syntrophus sp. (in: bacteria)]|nr:hypothetical protein [Syntrophus sp. (in: bacteria)]